MRVLVDAAGFQGQAESPLQRGVRERLGSGRRSVMPLPLGGKEQRGMAMGLPLLAQQFQRALRQGDVAVAIAFAAADVQEQALGVDIAHLQAQAFAQTESAGIDRGQADAVIEGLDLGEDGADFGGREDHWQLELGIGADQCQFGWPRALEGLLPKELESTDELGGRLASDLLDRLEMDAVLADLLEGDQVGRAPLVVLAELADTGEVGLFGAWADGQELQIIGEGF